MEWAPFKCLFWNLNDSIVKLMVSISSGVSLWCGPYYKNMLIVTTTTNTENLRQYKSRFSLFVEQRLAFASSANLVNEVKNLSSNFKRII